MQPRAVLFDLDGTLVDSSTGFILAINKTLVEYDQPPLDDDSIRQNISAGGRTVIRMGWGDDMQPELVEQVRDRFIENYREVATLGVQLFPGLDALFPSLADKGLALGVVTNKPEILARPVLEKFGLDRYLSTLICPEHVQQIKPDPEGLLLACRQIDVEPGLTLYCGDHSKDMLAAQAAGAQGIACGYGFIPNDEDFRRWPAIGYAEQSEQLPDVIQQVLNNR